MTFKKNKECEGKVFTVLVESMSLKDEGCVCGRTDGGRMVNFPGDGSLIGRMVDVKITVGKKTTLYGEMI